MSYEILLTARAEARLTEIPDEFRSLIEQYLLDLAKAPVSLSRSAVFPYPAGSQIYEFDVDYGGLDWDHFAILFRYGQDESTLVVIGIRHSKLRRPGDPDEGEIRCQRSTDTEFLRLLPSGHPVEPGEFTGQRKEGPVVGSGGTVGNEETSPRRLSSSRGRPSSGNEILLIQSLFG